MSYKLYFLMIILGLEIRQATNAVVQLDTIEVFLFHNIFTRVLLNNISFSSFWMFVSHLDAILYSIISFTIHFYYCVGWFLTCQCLYRGLKVHAPRYSHLTNSIVWLNRHTFLWHPDQTEHWLQNITCYTSLLFIGPSMML